MAKQIQVFGQQVEITELKVHATAVNEGFLLTLIAVGGEEDVFYATTVARERASIEDIHEMVSEASARFNEWATTEQALLPGRAPGDKCSAHFYVEAGKEQEAGQ